jgi:broad specificity phosphatase PhoE
MARIVFVTHPDVVVDPAVPVPEWRLSPRGLVRARAMLAQPWVGSVGAVFASGERKAKEAAAILAAHRGLAIIVIPELGENDRSATGYLAKEEFERVADAFFARPEASVRGWERAIDAQARIVGAIDRVIAAMPPAGDAAVVAHGAVGALLLCRLAGRPIGRDADQPATNGGNFFVFEAATRRLVHGWRTIDAPPPPGGAGT